MRRHERLKEINLFRLSKRRMQDNLKMSKILKGFDNAEIDHFTVDWWNITGRLNRLKVIGKRFLLNEAKHFFDRVANVWNLLSHNVVGSVIGIAFKNRLEVYLNNNSEMFILSWEE